MAHVGDTQGRLPRDAGHRQAVLDARRDNRRIAGRKDPAQRGLLGCRRRDEAGRPPAFTVIGRNFRMEAVAGSPSPSSRRSKVVKTSRLPATGGQNNGTAEGTVSGDTPRFHGQRGAFTGELQVNGDDMTGPATLQNWGRITSRCIADSRSAAAARGSAKPRADDYGAR